MKVPESYVSRLELHLSVIVVSTDYSFVIILVFRINLVKKMTIFDEFCLENYTEEN